MNHKAIAAVGEAGPPGAADTDAATLLQLQRRAFSQEGPPPAAVRRHRIRSSAGHGARQH